MKEFMITQYDDHRDKTYDKRIIHVMMIAMIQCMVKCIKFMIAKYAETHDQTDDNIMITHVIQNR